MITFRGNLVSGGFGESAEEHDYELRGAEKRAKLPVVAVAGVKERPGPKDNRAKSTGDPTVV